MDGRPPSKVFFLIARRRGQRGRCLTEIYLVFIDERFLIGSLIPLPDAIALLPSIMPLIAEVEKSNALSFFFPARKEKFNAIMKFCLKYNYVNTVS